MKTADLQHSDRRRSQRGMSLIETLVAVFVFTVVFLTALSLYQTANRTYMRTDASASQQQNVRYALDRMTETIRDAGASHNTLGSKKVADEQIEGAWESAIFVRGDFNNDRETSLENTTFPIVTTNNDEIVGFVLRKTGANGQTISIKADLTSASTGRDAVFTSNNSITNEETKNIAVAATTLAQQTNPPYQLVKVTFDNTTGDPLYEVVAENVFRLSFKYYPATGTTQSITSGTFSGADTERDERALVRRVEVSLIGMTERPDLGYDDPATYTPAEAAATKGYRKLGLSQLIPAWNLGKIGRAHSAVPAVSVNAPASITACTGHCRNFHITWPASSSAGVTTYSINITAPASGSVGAYSLTDTVNDTEYEFQEPDDDRLAGITRAYSFKVAAVANGVTGAYTTAVSQTAQNDAQSVPNAPQNVVISQASGLNAINVAFDQVSTNVNPVVATLCQTAPSGTSAPTAPWNQQAVDLTNYKILRSRSDGSNNGNSATTDISTLDYGELQNTASESTSFIDYTAAPCTPYWYRVQAADLCNVTSTASTAMTAAVSYPIASGEKPAKPSAPAVVGSVSYNGTNYSVLLTWDPVTRTASNALAAASHYRLERHRRLEGVTAHTLETVVGDYYDDQRPTVPDTPPGKVGGVNAYYRYFVKAYYDCTVAGGGTRISDPSDPFDLACTPPATHTISITAPAENDVTARPSEGTITIEVTPTGSGWANASIEVLQVTASGDVSVITFPSVPLSAGKFTAAWDVDDTIAIPDGFYKITANATTSLGCRAYAATRTIELDTVACGQKMVTASILGNGNNFAKSMQFKIENSCTNAVTFNSIVPAWQGVAAAIRITKVDNGATTLYNNATGTANGGTIALSSPITLTAGTTGTPSVSASFITITFTGNWTSDGSKNGTAGKFNSFLLNVTAPSTSSEQIIDGVPLP
ncbi:MAG TPA: prepilin-type N-terminal cleavage/methylation domain-containing protein [Thermoanaerobaculia bacterium]|nr:prepilin-type N-terminal cleavage/methylation domain-containing protein [Thermoanaerobaculia bacterium]